MPEYAIMTDMFLENTKLQSIISYILLAFVALFPFVMYKGYLYNGTSSRSVTLMFLMEVVALLGAYALWKRRAILTFSWSWITGALALYFAVLGVASFIGIDPLVSFWSKATRVTGFFFFAHLALMYMFLVSLFKEKQETLRFIKAIVWGSAAFSLGAFVGPEGLGWLFTSLTWDGFYFGNSSFAAMYLFGALLLSLYLFYTATKKRWWHYAAPILLSINPYFIDKDVWSGDFSMFIGEARATSYAVLGALGTFCVLRLIAQIKNIGVQHKILWGGFVLGVLGIATAGYSLMSPDGQVRELYMAEGTEARPIVWQLSEEMIAERPYFGWGLDNFEVGFTQHYDNTILTQRAGVEPWFDRAHNVFIDQAVDAGYVGLASYLLVYLVIAAAMVFVITRTKGRGDRLLAEILLVYFVFHFAEVQTAFDTSISYVLLACMAALATTLLYSVQKPTEYVLNISTKRVLAAGLFLFFGWGFVCGTLPIMKAEHANGAIRTVGSSAARIPYYEDLFGSPMDTHSFLWRTATDFQRGIGQDPSILSKPDRVEGLKMELALYEEGYRAYAEAHLYDVRAHFNLADTLIYANLFGENKLEEAQEVLDTAIAINPEIPQGYWMKAVTYLYQGDFQNARLWAQKGKEVNPEVEISQDVVEYIERNIRTFPEVDLYFFKYI